MFRPCEYCGNGVSPGPLGASCSEVGCPGNAESATRYPPEDPKLLVAIRAAVIAEACRWRGIPSPRTCGEFTRISDLFRYARAALAALREVEKRAEPRGPSAVDCPLGHAEAGDGCSWVGSTPTFCFPRTLLGLRS